MICRLNQVCFQCVILSSINMVALKLLLLLVSVLASESSDPVKLKVIPGQNITLPCWSPNKGPIIVVEWTRDNLDPYCVLMYRDSQFDSENQHPSFKNRVGLKESWMKDGDVSLVLMDATDADRGKYECRVIHSSGRSGKLTAPPISIVNLDVVARSSPGIIRSGSSGPMVGLTVLLLLLIS